MMGYLEAKDCEKKKEEQRGLLIFGIEQLGA